MRTIKQMRKELGLTQDKFAVLTGIPLANIRNWEQGIHECLPYVNQLLERMLVAEGKLSENPGKKKHTHESFSQESSDFYESSDGMRYYG